MRASTKRTPKPIKAARALDLNVQFAQDEDERESIECLLPSKPQIRRWVKAALRVPAEITVRFVGASEGARLNQDYRGKSGPTNVLSFIYTDSPLIGDLVICLPVVMREAAAQNKDMLAHCAHLIVHGVLHLQGWDHQTETEAQAMEALESEIVTGLGFAPPYAMQIS